MRANPPSKPWGDRFACGRRWCGSTWTSWRRSPAAREWGAAAALVSGEFLEGFALPDASGFEDWLAAERTAWRGRSVAVLVFIGSTSCCGRAARRRRPAVARRALALDVRSEQAIASDDAEPRRSPATGRRRSTPPSNSRCACSTRSVWRRRPRPLRSWSGSGGSGWPGPPSVTRARRMPIACRGSHWPAGRRSSATCSRRRARRAPDAERRCS